MIVEERDYHIYTGKLPELVRAYEAEGILIQKEILGTLVGAFQTEVGDLSSYVQLWAYDSFDERLTRRSRLAADPRWQAFLPKIVPLIHTQRNRILLPLSYSPVR
jgi:hypothetical protein